MAFELYLDTQWHIMLYTFEGQSDKLFSEAECNVARSSDLSDCWARVHSQKLGWMMR